jgi:ABC-2 type transport system ATP-binding protein
MQKNDIMVAKSLMKKYETFTALYPTTLSIAKGEILGLVGKNGAGKTTLLKLITGQSLPTSGELQLFSMSTPDGLQQGRKRMGAVVETPCFYRDMTAKQNLEYYRIQRGIPGKESVCEALKDVGLANTGNKKFKDFSLGMKQRLGLALALMNHPDFLVLDEPINGLDPLGIVEIRELLLTLNREKNITMLISGHVLSELQSLASVFVFIDHGKLIKTVTAQQLEKSCEQYLRLVVDREAAAAALLERHFPHIHYSIQPDKSIHIYDSLEMSGEFNRILVENNIRLSKMETRGSNLEDYFISLVGGTTDA